MSDWWERAYPGGPMVGPAFIRPLYPPDAAKKGKKASGDGKDVEALKRAVSRGGHWPWQEFDRAFSNQFSHGKSGNVSENGLAGLQRQNNVDATGWLGEYTYNLIRSARIPPGLPNAGEPLLDAKAIDLLEEYAKTFNDNADTLREKALAKAKTYLGYTESPPGTNCNMFGEWYGMNYEPWCAIFVSYAFEKSGGSPTFAQGSRYAYVPYILNDARAGRNGLKTVSDPVKGDLTVFDWSPDGTPDHIGIFDGWKTHNVFWSVEGNTSIDNDSNGGEVMRRERGSAGPSKVYFVRVAEP